MLCTEKYIIDYMRLTSASISPEQKRKKYCRYYGTGSRPRLGPLTSREGPGSVGGAPDSPSRQSIISDYPRVGAPKTTMVVD